jgi:hypothetical protein
MFADCSSLWSFCLPSAIRKLAPFSFAGSTVREISIEDGNDAFKVVGDFLMDFECISIKRFFGDLAEVTIGRGIEELSGGCFAYCTSISAVIFESGSRISRIGVHAFQGCSSLSSICIPSSVEQLCAECFCDCSPLFSVTFERGSRLSLIPDSAFRWCPSAFGWPPSSLSTCIPSPVRRIGKWCFAGLLLSAVSFGHGSRLSRIDECAFRECIRLSSICIPSAVKKIPRECFAHCSNLSTVTFESGSTLSLIDNSAFCQCVSLPSVCIPASVQRLGRRCFDDCHSLSTVTFEQGSRLSRIGDCAFRRCRSLSSICIPSIVEQLPQQCFADCKALKTVRFSAVSRLGQSVRASVFAGCSSLSSIWVPSSIRGRFDNYKSLIVNLPR